MHILELHRSDRLTRDNVKKLKFDMEIVSETSEAVPAVTARFRLKAHGFGRSMIHNLVGFVVDV
jgi:hypothetical protein